LVLAQSGPPANNGVLEFVALAVLFVLAITAVRRRRQTLRRRYGLQRRERAVRLGQQWLDPLVSLAVVAGVLSKDVAAGPAHLVAVCIGVAVGTGLGLVRAHFLFRRARRIDSHIVLERNWQELAVLFALVILQMIDREVSSTSTSVLALVGTGLLSVGVAESLVRVAYLSVRAHSAVRDELAGAPAGADRSDDDG
jgi:hypothetical protein